MSGISFNSQLIGVIAGRNRAGGPLTVADEPERLALTGIFPGQQVFQTDNSTLYQLNAPSEAQGGVFVSGGTLDGIYIKREGLEQGKPWYTLLGASAESPADGDSISWNTGRWEVTDGGGMPVYYCGNGATPDLALGGWANASDDSPASITVTSVTQGELDAGVTVSGAGTAGANGTKIVSGNIFARNTYGVGDNLVIFVGESWSVYELNDLYAYGQSPNLSPFPWLNPYLVEIGDAPAPTVTRNDICSAANWTIV